MRGYQCYDCGGVVEDDDFDEDDDACERCSSINVAPVEIFPCPLSTESKCEDDDHHWGIRKHVSEVDR